MERSNTVGIIMSDCNVINIIRSHDDSLVNSSFHIFIRHHSSTEFRELSLNEEILMVDTLKKVLGKVLEMFLSN